LGVFAQIMSKLEMRSIESIHGKKFDLLQSILASTFLQFSFELVALLDFPQMIRNNFLIFIVFFLLQVFATAPGHFFNFLMNSLPY
jgi:hypothetical protein